MGALMLPFFFSMQDELLQRFPPLAFRVGAAKAYAHLEVV